ncbi:MAG TPA: THUMP domain-containing protein [Gemmatimonadaceae bacterium]
MTSRKQGGRDCYAVVAPGLERLAAAELRAIGIAPRERGSGGTGGGGADAEAGGVAFAASDEQLFEANLRLRTASRVIVRVAEFRATAFHELERLARGVPWDAFVAPGGAVRLRVTCRKSRLYHSDGVAQRVAGAITRRVAGVTIGDGAVDADDDSDAGKLGEPAQLFLVRFAHDVCTISADSSGELLHRRGYRLATAKAPLRETLAAAMLLAMDYDGSVPLVDPLCGAGTIAIEAALIARRIAPGIARAFACERWPGAPTRKYVERRAHVREQALPRAKSSITASDRDAGGVAATLANAERAGVAADIDVHRGALSAMTPPAGRGLVLTNPPYGARVSAGGDVRNLYAQLGNVARAKCAGWTIALLSADRAMDAQLKLPLSEALRFKNGGISVRLIRAKIPVL